MHPKYNKSQTEVSHKMKLKKTLNDIFVFFSALICGGRLLFFRRLSNASKLDILKRKDRIDETNKND
jgi:hypothetical protein